MGYPRPASHQCFSAGIDNRAGREVVALARNDVADATARIRDVARKARDHVDMQVRDGLASSRPSIHANVVAVRTQLGVELALDCLDQGENRHLLVRRGVEPRRDEPVRHDQRVTGRHRVAVADGERQVVGSDPAVSGQFQKRRGHSELRLRPKA